MTFTFSSNVIGAPDVTVVSTIAPGIAILPSSVLEPQLGEIRTAWDSTLGSGEFIYLKCPASTAIPLGTLVYWKNDYAATVLPAIASSKSTGLPVAAALVAVASNTSVQYAWFQIQGKAVVLKTAIQVTPTNAPVFVAATAGRVKLVSSAGGGIIGAFMANSATVTTTTSTVTVYLNRSAVMAT